jgi:chitin disaccharide deacetylase
MTTPASRNWLVVTADDFGLSVEVNEAVEAAHRSGILSAASLMVSGPAAADAVSRARQMPRLKVGLHLVLVEGRPASPISRIPHLVDSRGELRRDMVRLAVAIAARPAVAKEAASEIAAQFEAFRATGLELDHVNAHKHFHLHPRIASAIFVIGRSYGMRALRVPREPVKTLVKAEGSGSRYIAPFWRPWALALRDRAGRAGVATPDWVFGLKWSGAMTPSRLAGLLDNLPAGNVEIYTHPATSDVFAGHAPGYRYTEEFLALRHPACLEALRRCGRPLGGYLGSSAEGSPY